VSWGLWSLAPLAVTLVLACWTRSALLSMLAGAFVGTLMSGTVLRPLSDRARIPQEKLAFLLDATTASVCILVPFTAWGAYLASLIAAQSGAVPQSPVLDAEQALTVFIGAIGYNFYPILMLDLAFGSLSMTPLAIRSLAMWWTF
jgi:Na+/H+ antiporter NhaC